MVMGLFAVYAILGRTFKSVPDRTAISELTINAQCMGTVVHHPLMVLCYILLSRFSFDYFCLTGIPGARNNA